MPNKRRIFTESETKKIKELYLEKEFGLVKVCRMLGTSINVLRKHLKEVGILRSTAETYIKRSKKMEKSVPEGVRAEILKAYKRGDYMTNMVTEFKLGQMVICRVLMEEGCDVTAFYTPDTHSLKALRKKYKR